VQVDPIRPALKSPGSERLKLKSEELLSNFGFKFNLRRYIVAEASERDDDDLDGWDGRVHQRCGACGDRGHRPGFPLCRRRAMFVSRVGMTAPAAAPVAPSR
jgi:hypothetical protein